MVLLPSSRWVIRSLPRTSCGTHYESLSVYEGPLYYARHTHHLVQSAHRHDGVAVTGIRVHCAREEGEAGRVTGRQRTELGGKPRAASRLHLHTSPGVTVGGILLSGSQRALAGRGRHDLQPALILVP